MKLLESLIARKLFNITIRDFYWSTYCVIGDMRFHVFTANDQPGARGSTETSTHRHYNYIFMFMFACCSCIYIILLYCIVCNWIKSDIISSLDMEPRFIRVMIVTVVYLNWRHTYYWRYVSRLLIVWLNRNDGCPQRWIIVDSLLRPRPHPSLTTVMFTSRFHRYDLTVSYTGVNSNIYVWIFAVLIAICQCFTYQYSYL